VFRGMAEDIDRSAGRRASTLRALSTSIHQLQLRGSGRGHCVGSIFNVYCDESCYQQHDHHGVMLLGGLWCPLDRTAFFSRGIRAIKSRHGIAPRSEIKWTRVSPGKLRFYLDLIEYFFSEPDLHFRGVIVPDKENLQHDIHGQSHDQWHYKMWFVLLSCVLSPHDEYRIYLDIKDTHSNRSALKLHDVLCNSQYDFSRKIISRVAIVRSDQSEILQLCDLILGAVSYANRGLKTSAAKQALVSAVRSLSGYSLTQTTLYRESKLNLLRWKAQEVASL
jgi:hypothetical protein